MNRRERRAMERMSQKEFQKVKDQTLKQLKKQYPDREFTKEEVDDADVKIKELIKDASNFQ